MRMLKYILAKTILAITAALLMTSVAGVFIISLHHLWKFLPSELAIFFFIVTALILGATAVVWAYEYLDFFGSSKKDRQDETVSKHSTPDED